MMPRKMASGMIASVGLAAASFLDAAPVMAQASGCEQVQKLLSERQTIVGQLNSASKAKRKLTPAQACSTLGRLVGNGNEAVKFATANQDWCQIPPSFIDGLKADNDKAVTIRNQACNAVKQQAAMQARAQKQAQGQSNNPFGGADAITGGALRVPQGAL
jgi:hypothetical protein